MTSVILKQFNHDCKGQPTVYLSIFSLVNYFQILDHHPSSLFSTKIKFKNLKLQKKLKQASFSQDLIVNRTQSSCHRRKTRTNPPPRRKGEFLLWYIHGTCWEEGNVFASSASPFLNWKRKEIRYREDYRSQPGHHGDPSQHRRSLTGHPENTCSQKNLSSVTRQSWL